jgi:hypothetical protein
MHRSACLLQQAELLIASSRAIFDLQIAGLVAKMAAEFQARAAEQERRKMTKMD